MGKAGKTYLTLFIRSYAFYSISYYLRKKYKIEVKLRPKKLRKKYSKYALPEISRLAKVLNLNYGLLWEAIILDKNRRLGNGLTNDERIKLYLSVEGELIVLVKAKQRQSESDYADEWGILATAVERAIGDALCDVEDELLF